MDDRRRYKVALSLTQWQAYVILNGINTASEESDADLSRLVSLEREVVAAVATAGIDTDAILAQITGDA